MFLEEAERRNSRMACEEAQPKVAICERQSGTGEHRCPQSVARRHRMAGHPEAGHAIRMGPDGGAGGALGGERRPPV